MSTKYKNLSEYNKQDVPKADFMRFGIVVSEWNEGITNSLADAAISTLLEHGAKEEDIYLSHVSGSFELPLGAQLMMENIKIDAVLCLGCVIQGETRHFDFICNSVSQSISKLNLDYNTPVIFGLLTTDTLQQAQDRSGGKYGNKGTEAAVTAIKMVDMKFDLES